MPITVLLADKLGTADQQLAAALAQRGLSVLHATNRAEALGLVGRADVVLMDRGLTADEALDVVRELHAGHDTENTPILIHTAKRDDEYEASALGAGAHRVLVRPLDYADLCGLIETLCPAPSQGQERQFAQERNERQLVAFLERMLAESVPAIRPQYDPQSPLAYSYPAVDEAFRLGGEESVKLLEDLVAHGLLDRRLVDKVHRCPDCGWHTVSFVEACPRCGTLDIDIESVIHHFACAYVGPWSEFRRGVNLVCPKCADELLHLGMDYEKPGDTYVCGGCGYAFTESAVQARCFRCRHECPGESVPATRVYEYSPNAKTSRAVEYGRIYGLDIQSVLFQDQSRTYRRDFLTFELDREIYRARRYDSALSLVLVNVEGLQSAPNAHDGVGAGGGGGELFEQVSEALRNLDVVSAIEEKLAALLLPETPLAGALLVAERVSKMITSFQSLNMQQQLQITAAVGELLPDHENGMQFFDYVHTMLRWALESRPGSVVDAHQWQEGAADA